MWYDKKIFERKYCLHVQGRSKPTSLHSGRYYLLQATLIRCCMCLVIHSKDFTVVLRMLFQKMKRKYPTVLCTALLRVSTHDKVGDHVFLSACYISQNY